MYSASGSSNKNNLQGSKLKNDVFYYVLINLFYDLFIFDYINLLRNVIMLSTPMQNYRDLRKK